MKMLMLVLVGVLGLGTAADAAARPLLRIREARVQAERYLDKAGPRWAIGGGASPPLEHRYSSTHRWPERLARNLIVFEFGAEYWDADIWSYDIEGYLRVRETRPGHYFVRGANVEVFESSNE